MCPNLPADLVTFTEEIFNGKLHFCAVLVEALKSWAKIYKKSFYFKTWEQSKS